MLLPLLNLSLNTYQKWKLFSKYVTWKMGAKEQISLMQLSNGDRPIVHWNNANCMCFSCCIHKFSKAMFLIGRQNVIVVVGILWIDFRRCWSKRQRQHFYLGQSPFYGHPTICSIKWIKSSQSARLLSLFATEQGQVIENRRDSK